MANKVFVRRSIKRKYSKYRKLSKNYSKKRGKIYRSHPRKRSVSRKKRGGAPTDDLSRMRKALMEQGLEAAASEASALHHARIAEELREEVKSLREEAKTTVSVEAEAALLEAMQEEVHLAVKDCERKMAEREAEIVQEVSQMMKKQAVDIRGEGRTKALREQQTTLRQERDDALAANKRLETEHATVLEAARTEKQTLLQQRREVDKVRRAAEAENERLLAEAEAGWPQAAQAGIKSMEEKAQASAEKMSRDLTSMKDKQADLEKTLISLEENLTKSYEYITKIKGRLADLIGNVVTPTYSYLIEQYVKVAADIDGFINIKVNEAEFNKIKDNISSVGWWLAPVAAESGAKSD
jgi:chromosome segregation ATPase